MTVTGERRQPQATRFPDHGDWASCRLIVPGDPATKGSAKAFVARGGRVVVKNDNPRARSWQEAIAWQMRMVAPPQPLREPMGLRVVLYMHRPAAHFGTGRNAYTLKPNAPVYCTTKPDSDKCLRAIFDSGTGVLWHDDSYVVDPHGPEKRYAPDGGEAWAEIEAWVIRSG